MKKPQVNPHTRKIADIKNLSGRRDDATMSIQQEHKDYYLICDNCTKEIGPFDEFYKAVEAKKEHGWKSKKVNGQWEDWCDKCCQEGGMKK